MMRPAIDSSAAFHAVHPTVLSRAVIESESKSDGLIRQNRNLLAWVRNPPDVIFPIECALTSAYE
jgi:hypothetical protein